MRAYGDKLRTGESYTHSVCLIDVYDTSDLVGPVGLTRVHGNGFRGEGVRKACITAGGDTCMGLKSDTVTYIVIQCNSRIYKRPVMRQILVSRTLGFDPLHIQHG